MRLAGLQKQAEAVAFVDHGEPGEQQEVRVNETNQSASTAPQDALEEERKRYKSEQVYDQFIASLSPADREKLQF